MENNNILSDDLFGIDMSHKLREDLRSAAQWGKIIGLVGLISATCSFLVSISQGSWFGGILSAAISVFMYIFLYKFGSSVKKGLEDIDQDVFNDGLKSLRTYSRAAGYLVIICIVLVVIAFLYILFLTASGGFSA